MLSPQPTTCPGDKRAQRSGGKVRRDAVRNNVRRAFINSGIRNHRAILLICGTCYHVAEFCDRHRPGGIHCIDLIPPIGYSVRGTASDLPLGGNTPSKSSSPKPPARRVWGERS